MEYSRQYDATESDGPFLSRVPLSPKRGAWPCDVLDVHHPGVNLRSSVSRPQVQVGNGWRNQHGIWKVYTFLATIGESLWSELVACARDMLKPLLAWKLLTFYYTVNFQMSTFKCQLSNAYCQVSNVICMLTSYRLL